MKKIFREEHGDVTASRNNFAIVYHALGQYNEAGMSSTTRHLSSRKRYSVRNIVMPLQVITNWEAFMKLLDSTMKRKNAKKRHSS